MNKITGLCSGGLWAVEAGKDCPICGAPPAGAGCYRDPEFPNNPYTKGYVAAVKKVLDILEYEGTLGESLQRIRALLTEPS